MEPESESELESCIMNQPVTPGYPIPFYIIGIELESESE